ncbi:HD-GYP domain-containing protein (c-di-GMP phosphodiesterase class II) [Armatimonas rosea]|uniref:HD-GYP domain-containing protein (C-di-GMP phosphodiesterase class II) n=1 Tax=Armatimonas rosea TaxID=685828 RepID=A0A7W9SSB8_ARMRO|nr:HD-GYP domain-containing protein (c-di-GMP phosphodiesterase class II) [Armatimonas rosea]
MTGEHWSGIIVANGRPRLLVISAVHDPQSQELQGSLLVYRNLDKQLASELAETLQGKITFLLDGKPIASAAVGGAPRGGDPEVRSRTLLPDDATGGRLALELGLSRAALFTDFERGRSVVAGVFLISCLLGVLLTVRLARRFTRPLEAVIAAAQRVRAGDWPEPLTVCGQAELGMLQEVFNEMTVSLRIHQLVTVQTLAAAGDARDTYTRGHSDRVAEYARQLAVALGFSQEQVERIHTIGTLHDVGKIGIPDSVLLKPGPLDPDERKVMESHAVRSEELIRNVPSLVATLPGIRHHHERWDGKGYPDGLAGEEIPLDARVLALADTFDALTSDRPYRKGWDFARALAEIERCAGTQFDPALVPYFIALWPAATEPAAPLPELRKAA